MKEHPRLSEHERSDINLSKDDSITPVKKKKIGMRAALQKGLKKMLKDRLKKSKDDEEHGLED